MTDHKYAEGDRVRLPGTFQQSIVRGGEIASMFSVANCEAVVVAVYPSGRIRIELADYSTSITVRQSEVFREVEQ